MSAVKEVVVTKLAVYGGSRVRPGARLTVPANFKATWFEDVVKKGKKSVAEEPAGAPETESDII
jgi:hypothetical protein